MTFQQSSLFFFFFNDTATTEIYTLSLHDALPIYTAKPKTPAPIVIDRFQFKQDEIGYLGKRRRHLYVLDVESGQSALITPGEYDELLPAWSPDGKRLVFVSKRRPDFDRDNNWDLYVIDAAPPRAPRRGSSPVSPVRTTIRTARAGRRGAPTAAPSLTSRAARCSSSTTPCRSSR